MLVTSRAYVPAGQVGRSSTRLVDGFPRCGSERQYTSYGEEIKKDPGEILLPYLLFVELVHAPHLLHCCEPLEDVHVDIIPYKFADS